MKNTRPLYILLGVFFLVVTLLTNYAYISQGKFPQSLMMIAMTIMAFCMAYLSPHFAEKDERAQKIRERGIFMSYFWSMGFGLMLIIVLNPNSPYELNSYETLTLFMTFYISSVFLNMSYYAYKY